MAGLLATVAILVNLSYLLRRSTWAPLKFGLAHLDDRAHVIAGVGAGLLALFSGFLWRRRARAASRARRADRHRGDGALPLRVPAAGLETAASWPSKRCRANSLRCKGSQGDHPGYREWVEQKVQDLVAGCA
ncbi:MAG: hypothetical protein R3E96_16065 [Planctomycetota bacterium]